MRVEFGEDYIGVYEGEEEIVYWTEQEWIEDSETVTPAIANAIHLAHTDPDELKRLLAEI